MQSPFVHCPHICDYVGPKLHDPLLCALEEHRILPNTVHYGGFGRVKDHILGPTCHSQCNQHCPGYLLRQKNTVQPLAVPSAKDFSGFVPQILDFFDTHTQEIVAFFRQLEVPFDYTEVPETIDIHPQLPIHPPAARFAPNFVLPELDKAPLSLGDLPQYRTLGSRPTLDILCVLDPSHSAISLDAAVDDLNFGFLGDAEALPKYLESLKALKKFFKGHPAGKQLFHYPGSGPADKGWLLYEWALLVVCLQVSEKSSPQARVHPVTLQYFVDGVSRPNSHEYRFISGMHLIVGGVDFSRDFMDGNALGHNYDLRGFQTFFNNLIVLSRRTYLWPPVDELIYSGDTVEQLYDIQSAAREQGTPFYNFLVHPGYPANPSQPPSGVLTNRTFPVCPELLGTTEPLSLEQDQNLVSESWRLAEGLVTLQWYSLPKAIQDREVEFGKVCVYFVNSKFRYAVHCMGDSPPVEVKSFVPLNAIRVREFGALVNVKVDRRSTEEAKSHFHRWVKGMHRNLVLINENKRSFNTKGTSGLRVFCRLDVGVIREPNGNHEYVITHIHRSHGTPLYPGSAPLHWASMMHDLADIIAELALIFRGAPPAPQTQTPSAPQHGPSMSHSDPA